MDVKIIDPKTTYIDPNIKIGKGTVIYPNTTIMGETIIGENNQIGPSSYIENVEIGNNNKVEFSKIHTSIIGNDNTVGPFANIRNHTILKDHIRIGNFVELKNVVIENNVNVAHLSYVGDATIDEGSNIGAGVITANYDGKRKHSTTIGKNVFVGSSSTLIAPVSIEDNAIIAAGSTITSDVNENDLAIARARQENKEGYASKIRNK